MISRTQIREAIEAPKQAYTVALIALGLATIALLIALGTIKGGVK